MMLRLACFAAALTAVLSLACSGSPIAPDPASNAPDPTPSPAPGRITDTFTGTIGPNNGICTDGLSFHRGKPCVRGHIFTMSEPGEIDAFLTWPTDSVDVDLEIWRGSTMVIGSAGVAPLTDRSRTMDQAGPHEIRVILNSGTTATDYTVRVTHPR